MDDLAGIETLVLGDSFNLFILPLEAYTEEYSVKKSQRRSYCLDFYTLYRKSSRELPASQR